MMGEKESFVIICLLIANIVPITFGMVVLDKIKKPTDFQCAP